VHELFQPELKIFVASSTALANKAAMTAKKVAWPIAHMRKIGSKGGKAGRGERKRRSPEHYARLSKLGVAARLAKAKAK
jgi:hypothetical protein